MRRGKTRTLGGMADVSAILTVEDKLEFAAWLSEHYAVKFVVDHDQSLTALDGVSAIRSVLNQDLPPLIFVLSAQWSSLPLYTCETTNQYKGKVHYVMQRYGGPSFMWSPGNVLRTRGGSALAAGLFGDYPYYYVAPESSETVRRPASMTTAFRAAQKWLRTLCEGRRTRYKKTKAVGPWISARASDLVKRRAAVLANNELAIS